MRSYKPIENLKTHDSLSFYVKKYIKECLKNKIDPVGATISDSSSIVVNINHMFKYYIEENAGFNCIIYGCGKIN